LKMVCRSTITTQLDKIAVVSIFYITARALHVQSPAHPHVCALAVSFAGSSLFAHAFAIHQNANMRLGTALSRMQWLCNGPCL
jgi:hypothetical protein